MDDLFIVVYKLAEWVKTNVNYDLSTLTASVSQKASWVLDNKEGVCDEITNLFIALSRALGISISRILEFLGNKVVKVNLNNDRGIHICNSMLAYKLWGKNKQPDKKSDHFVGDFYTLFAKKAREIASIPNTACNGENRLNDLQGICARF